MTKEISSGWYKYNESDIVIVFIHGIFSNSEKCWRSADSTKFWPQLIIDDKRYNSPSIYLAEFYTAVDSNDYGIQECATEILGQLKRLDENLKNPPLSKNNIMFVTHSTGGIVARYLLEAYSDEFLEKKIGIALYASPSFGSKLASSLRWAASLFKNKLAHDLCWGSSILSDLDGRFRNLLTSDKLNIVGFEAYENRSMLHIPLLNNSSRRIVEKESASRYFGKASLVPKSDHSSIVKPSSMKHYSHEILLDFMGSNGFIFESRKDKSDVLFDQFRSCHDDFYIVRENDELILRSLGNYSLWVCGPTGVGKTVAIQRAIFISGLNARYISLSSCLNETMEYIFNDILLSVTVDDIFVKNLSIPDAIRRIALEVNNYCKSASLCLMIEEIPIKDQAMFVEFSEYIYTLMLQLKDVDNFKIILSSIYEPSDVSGGELEKVFEKCKIIKTGTWASEEIKLLIELIENEINFSVSKVDCVEQFNGSPREVKQYYRDELFLS